MFVKVPKEDFHLIISKLGRRLPRSAMLYSLMKLLEIDGVPPNVETSIYSWGSEEEALIVAIQYRERYYNDYAVVLCPSTQINHEIVNALDELIDWRLPVCFCAIEPLYVKKIEELCQKNGTLVDSDQCDFLTMSNEAARAMNPKPEGKVVVKELETKDAELVAKRWTFAEKGTQHFMETLIKHTGSVGVYNEGGRLVSWVMIFCIGSINALYTEDDCRKLGYGKLTMEKACQLAGEKGLVPNVQIVLGNEASTKLMTKLGFTFSHIVNWIIYKPLANS